MDAHVELLEVGDHVKFRDSSIMAGGVIVSTMMQDYVAVLWDDMHLTTAHRRGTLALDLIRKQ
jgi:hypothetical protein